jgi:hypothetical protein
MHDHPETPSSNTPAGDLLTLALQPEGRLAAAVAGAPEVPGYNTIGQLGVGASGEVWLANEPRTGRIVALKILHRRGGGNASQEVIRREIHVLAELVHPNIVQLYGAVSTIDGRQGLATEWIDGWPLDEWLRRHSEATVEQHLELFRGIVRGVAFLHDHGVIHRDLKPANLIVNQAGQPKIVDFGLARLHQEGAVTTTDGGSIGVSGTLHFMAPEQAANGDGARATPVDVYALGLVLYRLLTGAWLRPPEGTPAETLAAVLNPPPLVLAGRAGALPRDLQSILRMALAPDPARRYRNARELEADLDRFAAKLPVAARRHTVGYLTLTLLRRHAWRSLAAACLVLAGAVAGGAIYHRHRQLTERNQANLRQAYALTALTLGQLGDELRSVAPEDGSDPRAADPSPPANPDRVPPRVPVNEAGELDLRFYQAQRADLQSATAESRQQNRAALTAIRRALDLYSEMAREVPDDPGRLFDAAKARLNYARLLYWNGRGEAAGGEALKSLRQLERLVDWPGFKADSLPTLRCSALRIAAQSASGKGDHQRAAEYASERLAIARTWWLEISPGTADAAAPPIGLAASDLAACAIAGGPPLLDDADGEIDRAIAVCRATTDHQSDPLNLAYCLHAKAQILLEAGALAELEPIVEEGARLLIGGKSGVLQAEIPLVRSYCETTTAWARAAKDHPDIAVFQAALRLASRFVDHIFGVKAAGGQPAFQRVHLRLCESHLAIRLGTPREGAAPAAMAVGTLRARLRKEPDRLSLIMQTAAALHQARKFAEFPEAGWCEQDHGALLALLLKQLAERAAELTPEQQRELSLLQ